MNRRFERILGHAIEMIPGQERFAYALSDTQDLYDLLEWEKHGGYRGSVLYVYDLQSGAVHQPFPQVRDVAYGAPHYVEGAFYLLQGSVAENRIAVYRYIPGQAPQCLFTLPADQVDLYNLRLIGNPVHLVSEDGDLFRSDSPEAFAFRLSPEESVLWIEGDKVYTQLWVEEGWDEENDCQSPDYAYYYKTRIRDRTGSILSEEVGSLFRAPTGEWWMS